MKTMVKDRDFVPLCPQKNISSQISNLHDPCHAFQDHMIPNMAQDPSTSIVHSHEQPVALHYSFRNLMEPLLVLFNKAASMVLRNKDFYIAYSIPGGVYGYFKDYPVNAQELEQIASRIHQIIGRSDNFRHQVLPAEKIRRYFEHTNRGDIIQLLESNPENEHITGLRLAQINGFGEMLVNHVQENHDKLKQFRLLPFREGFFLVADPDFFTRAMPSGGEQSKYFAYFEEAEDTMKHLGISNFAELNDVIRQQRLPEFIKLAEAWQARRITQIADDIAGHHQQPRLIFIAGPTSSGKTTTANRLKIELQVMKKEVLILSLDNYYLPHSVIPDDPNTGLKNFELITALDLELFRNNINDLMAGKAVNLPKYHFDGQGAIPEEKATRITDTTFVIVEGIHGLNPDLWKDMVDVDSYRLYVSALSTLNIHDHLPLSTSDHRLIRRLVRDHLFRGYSFNETIKRWPDVMRNEYQSIFPFQESAHAILNSALIYEPAVFSHYAPAVALPEKAENEQIREEVNRLNRILSLLIPIDPKDIPPTSILREFIGGSSFQYS